VLLYYYCKVVGFPFESVPISETGDFIQAGSDQGVIIMLI